MGKLFPDERHMFRRQLAGDPEVKTWEAKELNLKAHVVCGECNNGWMSDLEAKQAQPAIKELILSDSPARLEAKRIGAIAAFGYKTAAVCHAMQRHDSPCFPKDVFSPSRLLKFRSSLTVPSGVQVWLSCVAAEDFRNGVVRLRYARSPVGSPNPFKLYACTFGVGRFLMQIVATEWTKSYARRRSIPVVGQNPVWDDVAIPIWPLPNSTYDVTWPPRKQLRGEAVDAFSDRWRRFTVPTFPIV